LSENSRHQERDAIATFDEIVHLEERQLCQATARFSNFELPIPFFATTSQFSLERQKMIRTRWEQLSKNWLRELSRSSLITSRSATLCIAVKTFGPTSKNRGNAASTVGMKSGKPRTRLMPSGLALSCISSRVPSSQYLSRRDETLNRLRTRSPFDRAITMRRPIEIDDSRAGQFR
jgi:hypothetical protein